MIKGLTDRRASFPQIGTLRKGAPKPEKGPGKDLEYFRFDCRDAAAMEAFEEQYGKQPKSIRVYVPFATVEENFEAWREHWTASALQHRCDGENCVRWLNKDGTYSDAVEGFDQPKPCPGGCKQVGRLQVIIPALRRMAFVTVLTTSIHDILQINANLLALEAGRGDLRGIPMILKRAPRKISTPRANGERQRAEKWLITIEAEPEWAELQFASLDRMALQDAQPLALPEWDGDEEEEETPVEEIPESRVDMHTLDAIDNLWPVHGSQLDGKVISIEEYLKEKIGITDPRLMTASQADVTLKWLQKKALDASTLGKKKEKQPPADQVTKADREAMVV